MSRTMRTYYTEYPTGEFQARSDKKALERSAAKVVYRETEDGKHFIVLRGISEVLAQSLEA